MIAGIIIGMFIGTGLGVLIMALMIAAKEADEQMDHTWHGYSDCTGCKYQDLSSWEEPCSFCHGEYYKASIGDEE